MTVVRCGQSGSLPFDQHSLGLSVCRGCKQLLDPRRLLGPITFKSKKEKAEGDAHGLRFPRPRLFPPARNVFRPAARRRAVTMGDDGPSLTAARPLSAGHHCTSVSDPGWPSRNGELVPAAAGGYPWR